MDLGGESTRVDNDCAGVARGMRQNVAPVCKFSSWCIKISYLCACF